MSNTCYPQERFWDKVNKNGPVPSHCPELGPCWIWMGAKARDGYGNIRIGETRQNIRTHRYAFFLTFGNYPENALHRCDNPPCCNPAHLFDGTAQDNYDDMVRKGRAGMIGQVHYKTTFTDEQIVEIRTSMERVRDLAKRFDISSQAISAIRASKNWKHLPPSYIPQVAHNNKGEMNGCAKLTADAARQAKIMCANGVKRSEIAKHFGVSWSAINDLATGRTWREI